MAETLAAAKGEGHAVKKREDTHKLAEANMAFAHYMSDILHDTLVRFAHTGWREAGEHFRIPRHCWAMYLRILRNWLKRGETVSCDERLVA